MSLFKVLIYVFFLVICIAGAYRDVIDDDNSEVVRRLYTEALKESFFGNLDQAIKCSRNAALLHHGSEAWKYDLNNLLNKPRNKCSSYDNH